MWRALAIAVILAGCAQTPSAPTQTQAVRIEPVPGKAVVYIVRTPMDSHETGSLMLDEKITIAPNRQTYYRWETTPGRHRIAGLAGDSSLLQITTEAGKLYFVEYTVLGTRRSGVQSTSLRRVDEQRGRGLLSRAQPL